MTTLTRAETARWLSERDQFLILTHVRPDGDTLGSAALLCRGLRKLGKTAHILENPGITAKYASLHEGLTQKEALEGDTLVSVDVAAPNMLPDAFRPLQARIALRIDHHGAATPFTPLSLVDAGAAACGEILFDVLCELGTALDKPMADALYTAVSTDTGCFRYANTTAHTFATAAACAQAGADLSGINLALFETNSFARLKIQSYLVEHARFYRDGALAVCPLPRAVEESVGAGEDDLENISGFPRSIAGVKMAATLREDPDGRVKISVRAVPGYDASAVCARFGGGGHKGAAGASLHLPLEEAAQAVAAAMEELV
ncbi:MAG: DHH family phosphoesterase [Candidatus Faecousia sp.]|nr:DHH family phosphoesterase [Candidatus Faecousia sp.]